MRYLKMNEQKNIELTQQIFTAFGEGNIKFLLNLLAEDVEWQVAGSPEHTPLSGEYHGVEQVAHIFKTVSEFLQLQQFQPQEFVAQDDRVVVFGHAAGRILSTNRPVEYDWVHLYTFNNGKISKFREYLDTAAIATALHDTNSLFSAS
jgi:uncharacterized protein